jgi:hypothetical protein
MHLRAASDVVYQEIDDEVVLLKLGSQESYGLGEVGAHVWKLLLETGDLATTSRRLCEEYSGDSSTIDKELTELVGELLDAGLLERV